MISILDHLSSRHLTLDDAAEKAGIAPERFRAVAAGAVDASLGEMRRIAKALKVPLSAIVGGKDSEPIKVLFRQTLGQRATVASTSVEVVANQIRSALAVASRFPPTDLTWLDRFQEIPADLAHVEQMAQQFRAHFGQLDDADPFTLLPQVVDQLGVLVLMCQEPTIEGVSAIVDGRCIVLVGPRTFKPRMLFTLAHELGHLVAHHDRRGYALLDNVEDFDRAIEVPQRDEERFADAFASALLLPQRGVLMSLRVIRDQLKAKGPLGDVEILTLAGFYGVGFEVAARRCEQLDLLPPRGARALYQQLEHEHGNPERRAAELGLPRRQDIEVGTSPTLIRAASDAVRQGTLSIGRAAELLNVPLSVLYAANVDAAG